MIPPYIYDFPSGLELSFVRMAQDKHNQYIRQRKQEKLFQTLHGIAFIILLIILTTITSTFCS